MDPSYPAVPLFNFLGFILVLIPLPWQLQSWNTGTCMFSIWVSLACLDCFIRTTVWKDSVLNYAPVYCDISSRLAVAVPVAIPACSLCINSQLFKITRMRELVTDKKVKRRVIIQDLLLCAGLPLLIVALYYIVQCNRFLLLEEIGCNDAVYITSLALLILYVPPIALSLVSVFFSPLVFFSFLSRKKEMQEFQESSTSFTRPHYFRLMAFSLFDALGTLPSGVLNLCLSILSLYGSGLSFWPGWDVIHANDSDILTITSIMWRTNRVAVAQTIYLNWIYFVFAFVFFLLFGLTNDMLERYGRLYWRILKPFGYYPPVKKVLSGIRFQPAVVCVRRTEISFLTTQASALVGDDTTEVASVISGSGSEGIVNGGEPDVGPKDSALDKQKSIPVV